MSRARSASLEDAAEPLQDGAQASTGRFATGGRFFLGGGQEYGTLCLQK
jgi:hypothetical protein